MNKNFIFLALVLAITTTAILPTNRKTKRKHDATQQAAHDEIHKQRIMHQNLKRDVRAARRAKQATTRIAVEEDSQEECAICLVTTKKLLTVTKAQTMLTCTHHNFHKTCLSRWLRETRNTCPLCRAPGQNPTLTVTEHMDLHQATSAGNLARVEELLAANYVDINAEDESGRTPLQTAATCGNAVIVAALILANADLEIQDQWGNTALYLAATYGRTNTVKILINAHADVDTHNDMGNTPLHTATYNHHIPIVEALLAAGADTTLRNMSYKTAAHLARTEQMRQLICVHTHAIIEQN